MYERFYKNISDFIFVKDEPKAADVIFVPGNGYPHMAEAAAELWKQGYAKWVLPSGRFTVTLGHFAGVQKKREIYSGDYHTEWEFLAEVLEKNGVSSECILKEDQATFTYENAIRSKTVLKEQGIRLRRGIICCNSVHARRCKMYFELVFPEAEFLIYPVVADEVTKENWYLSQKGIDAVLGEMERCGKQFEYILKEMQGI
ncbi:MAG: YdcF family protein [Lachnospiraceae bacterium]|nr:YdcF family protein [Lachnospiraceae bacterium]